MSDRDTALALVRGAAGAIELGRQRIDDLNVYPVPDGDTGTNLALTVQAIAQALEASRARERSELAREVSRAALLGARGNSGVILSQLVRGLAESLAEAEPLDGAAVARALRSASDAAYRAVRQPVEGTMLTVSRALAEEAETSANLPLSALLARLVERGEEAVAETPDELEVLREAGVVDAGAAGLVELLRGASSALVGKPLAPGPAVTAEPLPVAPVHQELSRYRYCTAFVVEGELEPVLLERELEPLGDSLLVVGDSSAVKVHVHTDDPGAALAVGTRAGSIENVEIANMHRQTEARERRLLAAVPDRPELSAAVAVAAGEGNRLLFENLGSAGVVEGGQTMNPAAAELVAAIAAASAREVVLLPNNANVLLTARQAAKLAGKPVELVPTTSIQAGLAALVVFDPARTASENAAEMAAAAARVATGSVTRASRDLRLNGHAIRAGEYLGLLEDEPFTGGADFDSVARQVVERLLDQPRELLLLLTGEEQHEVARLVGELEHVNPGLEIEVHEGGQPHYPLLAAAE
ncbi:MAG TPA: DAK2 domain-containing protein [Gaiellaceae bacterium]